MTLLFKLKSDLEKARTANPRNPVLISLVTTLYADSFMVGKNKGNRETTDEEVISVVKRFIKGLEEILQHCKDNNRIKDQAEFELTILNQYMPTQMSEEQLKLEIDKLKDTTSKLNLGVVMKHFKENFAGLYDGTLLSKVVKQILEG